MNRSKVGTRITLSDRFKLIRQEQQTRKIMVNPSIESPSEQFVRPMKNFNSTVSRDDRPRAILQQGSERNRRLVLQMATNSQLMQELQQNPQMFVNLPIVQQANNTSIINNKRMANTPSVRARLGLRSGNSIRRNGNVVTGSIKNRLGRKPIAQRLGLAQTPKINGRINLRNRTNGFIANNIMHKSTHVFKSKNVVNRGPRNRILGGRRITRKTNSPRVTAENVQQEFSFLFSPSGKLVQIEYALAAVAAGASSVGIKAMNGVVMATEKKTNSILTEEHSLYKVEQVTDHIGMIYSGMGPDYRLLVRKARKIAQEYFLVYSEPIPTTQLVQRVAHIMQEYTQSGGVRPFGVSLLIAGWDDDRPYLFQCDPSGAYFAWKATALGKNHVNGKSFLEKRYSEDLELEDAIQTAILTLKESFEGQMTQDNIEIGICNKNGFKRLSPAEVKDYLATIA
ncbi:proteasome subunit alpha type-2-like protein [Euroglyphus maynei]|uniref:Proteasome subunit alpha type-2 n=1 Tax=Euroglyphus maynei TaxID=6958 RepID=A0A1Y3BF05_EURMA|nr:proteasome subunit alpha type-2-like protein [Euroglyphus maynei]